MSCFILNT